MMVRGLEYKKAKVFIKMENDKKFADQITNKIIIKERKLCTN